MKTRVGLIGTGGFSHHHAQILANMDAVQVVSILGTSKTKADLMASKFRDANGYKNLSDMLDDSRLDAVYICVPPMSHGSIEMQLIERDIPFFIPH